MPASRSDARLLAACAVAIVGGCALIAVGALLEPPRLLLRLVKSCR